MSDDEPAKKRRKRVIDSVSNIDSDSDPSTSDNSNSSSEEESDSDIGSESSDKPATRLVKTSSSKPKTTVSAGGAPAQNRRTAFLRSAMGMVKDVQDMKTDKVVSASHEKNISDQIDTVTNILKTYVETGHKKPTEALLDALVAMCQSLVSSHRAIKAQMDRLSQTDASASRRIGITATDAMVGIVEQVAKMQRRQVDGGIAQLKYAGLRLAT